MTVVTVNYKGRAWGIRLVWQGAGEYWFNAPDGQPGAIALGYCADLHELRDAVREAVEAGSGDEDWGGWSVRREDVSDPHNAGDETRLTKDEIAG